MRIVLQSQDLSSMRMPAGSIDVSVLLSSAFFTFILGVLFGTLLSLRYPVRG